jgi:hypothetical protein
MRLHRTHVLVPQFPRESRKEVEGNRAVEARRVERRRMGELVGEGEEAVRCDVEVVRHQPKVASIRERLVRQERAGSSAHPRSKPQIGEARVIVAPLSSVRRWLAPRTAHQRIDRVN